MEKGTPGIILAGGKSLRFGGPAAKAKPIIQVNGVPLVLRVASKLAAEGAERICVLTGQNHREIRDALQMDKDTGLLFVGPGSSISFELRYSGDETGSAGRLLALDRSELASGALLSYTDVLTDAPLGQHAMPACRQGTALSVMTVTPRLPWGIVHAENGIVTQFKEKPRDRSIRANAGLYWCSPSVLDFIKDRSEMFEKEPMERMIRAGVVRTWHYEGHWASIDSPKDVAEVEMTNLELLLDDNKPVVLPSEVFEE
jgi:glucose-1-phosphate cytidylyltransferase